MGRALTVLPACVLCSPPASQHKSTVRATPSPRRASPVASDVRKPKKHTASGVKKSTTSKRNRNRNSTKRAPKTSQKWTYAINGLMRATGDVQRAWGQAVGTAANGRPLPQLLSLDDPSTVEVILDCVGEQCALQGMPEYSREGLRAQLSKPCALFPTRDFRRIKLTLPIAKTCITVRNRHHQHFPSREAKTPRLDWRVAHGVYKYLTLVYGLSSSSICR